MITQINKQIYANSLNYPLESVQVIFSKSIFLNILEYDLGLKIKKFLGSSIFINGSGFIWNITNDFSIVLISNFLEDLDFSKSYQFKITHINGESINENYSININLMRNTLGNSTILQFLISYSSNFQIQKIWEVMEQISFKKITEKIFEKIQEYLQMANEEKMSITHSILINSNFIEAFKFFRNMENFVKAMDNESLWKINYDGSSSQCSKYYKVETNTHMTIVYKIIEESGKKDEYMKIIIHKSNGESPAINEILILTFYNIDNNKTLLVHESKIPININSNLHNTVSNFTFYIIQKVKSYFESSNNKK